MVAYDNPAALNTQLQKYLDMPYNDYQYLLSTLYSVYSLPNTVLPFVFGSLVDRFGPQRVLLGLSACVCIGQTIFSVGVQTRQIWMMLVGRAIFGVGGESCGVAQASITTMHFRHPAILQHLPGILRREASFSESIRSVRFKPGYTRSGTRPSLHIVTVQDEPKQKPRFQQQRKQHHDSWWGQWVADLEFFPSTFWLICALVVLLYGTVVPFNNIASDFLQTKWYHDNPRKAAAVMGIPDTLGAILVPGFGFIVDKYGGRASTLIASAAIMVVVHTTLGFTSLSPIFAFSLLAPPIVATIRVIGDSFIPVEMFFIAMGLCGIIVGFALKNIDRRDGGALENPEIQMDVPVIVPQTAASASTSTVASPVPSQSRSLFGRQKKRPALNCIQTLGSGPGSGGALASGSGSLWTPKRWQNNLDEGSEAFGSPCSTKAQGGSEGGIGDFSQDSPLVPNNSNSLLLPRITKPKKWFGKPLLQRSLPRVGSPLLQQYSSSPRRYGSFSSPSIASTRIDGEFDLEEGGEGGEKRATAVEDYSVAQHPILYNPLRGSSGSFRITRTAKPIAFGAGEELIYLNGQEVELGYDDDDVEYQSGSEQDYGDEEFDGEGDNDATEHGSEVDEPRRHGVEYNSNNNRGNQDGSTKSDSTTNTIAPDPAEET
ncbi:hypothetical protein KI688_010793 [Linnemannia hyalina]|uniref:Lysosomal dipeptide transporter MFSD1 n=1 Tax=Linnemannia hyalina TaxID=64524 RepID=A0A9P7XWA1_9FUNG|nr:hypothetical protein KI688_010793 [Linnemannia hyalina]